MVEIKDKTKEGRNTCKECHYFDPRGVGKGITVYGCDYWQEMLFPITEFPRCSAYKVKK